MKKINKLNAIIFAIIIIWLSVLTFLVVDYEKRQDEDGRARAETNMILINKLNEQNVRIEKLENK